MFVSALDLTGEAELTVLKGDGECIVRVPIGFDPEADTVFSVFVAMSTLAGYADVPGFELVFAIVETSLDGAEVRTYWDGRDTRALLAEPDLRAWVRKLILSAVTVLIDELKPNLVSMVTRRRDLPATALIKYHKICALFRSQGFTAGKADPWHGQHIWMMTR